MRWRDTPRKGRGLAGGLLGLLVGLIEGVGGSAPLLGPALMMAAAGGLLGYALGPALSGPVICHWLSPDHFWPRCQRSAQGLLASLGAAVGLALGLSGHWVAAGALGAAVALSRPLARLLGRGAQRAARRWQRWARPRGWLALATTLTAWALSPSAWSALLWWLLAWHLIGEGVARAWRRQLARWPRAAPWMTRAMMCWPALALWGSHLALRGPADAAALVEAPGAGPLLLSWARAPLDIDGDGFSGYFGGLDCAEGEPAHHPGAWDVPGNNVDEDCDGVDLPGPLVMGPPLPEPDIPVAPTPRPLATQIDGAPPWAHNVALVTIESLPRAVAYGAPETQGLAMFEALRPHCTRFERAYTPAPDPFAGVAVLHASRWLSTLEGDGRRFVHYEPQNHFLAELLGAHGVSTAAFPAHWYFHASVSGLEQGFDVWQPVSLPVGQMEGTPTAEAAITRLLRWVDAQPQGEGRPTWLAWTHLTDLRAPPPMPGAATVDEGRGLRSIDQALRALVNGLWSRADVYRTAIVIAGTSTTSGLETPPDLSEPALRVPLLICMPSLPGRTNNTLTSLVDVAPTILELAGAPEGAHPAAQGRSLWPAVAGKKLEDHWIYAEQLDDRRQPFAGALIERQWKLLVSRREERNRLYHLLTDPEEGTDRRDGAERRYDDMLERGQALTLPAFMPRIRPVKGRKKGRASRL